MEMANGNSDPMQRKIDLTMIYGSTRDGRLCDRVADWVAARIEAHGGFTLERLDPARRDVADGLAGHDRAAHLALRHRIGAAEAFVVVTPEYNHSFTAPMKALIDSAYSEWQAKPLAFVSYGGRSGGIRAVEHLRSIFAELHAVGIRDGLAFANVWDQFDDSGRLLDPGAAEAGARVMLERLQWWALTLRQGRAERNYGEVAA
jgi:NAD(P)H-dependent FMN reductase